LSKNLCELDCDVKKGKKHAREKPHSSAANSLSQSQQIDYDMGYFGVVREGDDAIENRRTQIACRTRQRCLYELPQMVYRYELFRIVTGSTWYVHNT